MALLLDTDPNTGLEISDMYYRIDKINFNDYQFQIVVTGYASIDAYTNTKAPIVEPRAYTWDYDKADLASSELNIFEYAYTLLKSHSDFKGANDHIED